MQAGWFPPQEIKRTSTNITLMDESSGALQQPPVRAQGEAEEEEEEEEEEEAEEMKETLGEAAIEEEHEEQEQGEGGEDADDISGTANGGALFADDEVDIEGAEIDGMLFQEIDSDDISGAEFAEGEIGDLSSSSGGDLDIDDILEDEDDTFEDEERRWEAKRRREEELQREKLRNQLGDLATHTFKKRRTESGETAVAGDNSAAASVGGGVGVSLSSDDPYVKEDEPGLFFSRFGSSSLSSSSGGMTRSRSAVVEKLAAQFAVEVKPEGVLEVAGARTASSQDTDTNFTMGDEKRFRSYHSQMANIETELKKRQEQERQQGGGQSAPAAGSFGGGTDDFLGAFPGDPLGESADVFGSHDGTSRFTETQILDELRRREQQRQKTLLEREAERAKREAEERARADAVMRESVGEAADRSLGAFAHLPGMSVEKARAMQAKARESEKIARERVAEMKREQQRQQQRHSSSGSASKRSRSSSSTSASSAHAARRKLSSAGGRSTSRSGAASSSSSSSSSLARNNDPRRRSSSGSTAGSHATSTASTTSSTGPSLEARRIAMKQFVARTIMRELQEYFKQNRIASKDDFKHLSRKLAHAVMQKETKRGFVKKSDTEQKIVKLVSSFFSKLGSKPYRASTASGR